MFNSLIRKIMRSIKILVLFLALGLASCEDFLDKTPPTQMSNQLALSNFTNMTLATNAAYGKLLSTSYYGSDMIVLPEIRGIDARSSKDKSSGRYHTNYAWAETPGNSVYLWTIAYSVITDCCNILEAIEGYSELGITQSEINQIKGENMFLRALVHFDLCRVYAQAPINATGENNLGVPIIKHTEIGSPSRSTVQEVYTFIINELLEAEQLLDDPNRGTTAKAFASKEAAQALLAKVYMYNNDWSNAYTYATKVIESGKFSMVEASEYESSWENDLGSSEVIFMVYGEITNTYWGGYDDIGFLYEPEKGYGDVCVTNALLNLFEPGDVRADVFYDAPKNCPAGEKWCKKYPGKSEVRNNNIIILRLPEMYLIRAEAAFNGASQGNALADLNAVRTKRGLAATTTVTEEEVLKERRRELNNECNGMWDITRKGRQVVRDASDLYSSTSPVTLEKNYQALPIIMGEIERNSNIVQNPY